MSWQGMGADDRKKIRDSVQHLEAMWYTWQGFVSDVTMKTRLGIVPWFYDQIWVNKNWMGHVRNQFLETGGFIIKQVREGSNIIQHLHMIWPLIDGIVAAALDFR